jgi:hypothetical protein
MVRKSARARWIVICPYVELLRVKVIADKPHFAPISAAAMHHPELSIQTGCQEMRRRFASIWELLKADRYCQHSSDTKRSILLPMHRLAGSVRSIWSRADYAATNASSASPNSLHRSLAFLAGPEQITVLHHRRATRMFARNISHLERFFVTK